MFSFKSNSDPSVFAYSSNKTSNYTITLSDYVVPADNSGGALTITLPNATTCQGKVYWVGKIEPTLTSAITIATVSSQLILPTGATTTTLNTKDEWVCLISNGANWQMLERRIPSFWSAATVTGTWISNTTYDAFYRRIGDSSEWTVKVNTSGAPTSANLTITLPSGFLIDTAKLTTGKLLDSSNICSDNDVNQYPGANTFVSTSVIQVNTTGAGGLQVVTQANPFTFGNNDYVEMYFKIPISGWKG